MTEQFKAPDDAALIVVDVLNDFCKGGALEVPEGDKVVPVINNLRSYFNTIVLQQDWHPKSHKSFASAHEGKNAFEVIETSYGPQVLWPDHCVQGTKGAEFHKDLIRTKSDFLIRKGTNPDVDSYSAFYENDKTTQPHFENGKTFTEQMQDRGIKKLVFTGLALDYCVGWNALDAVKEGFEAIVILDATRPIADDSEKDMLKQLEEAGVTIVTSYQLPSALTKGLSI